MKKIDRKKFFGIIASSSLLAFVTSSLPNRLIKNLASSSKRNMEIKIHPEAVKRNKV